MKSGIEVIVHQKGIGKATQLGDVVSFKCIGFLNRGDCIQSQSIFRVCLGRREIIAGIEKSLIGVKPGGYKRVKISPHLAYREMGILGLIPPNAVLVYDLWLLEIVDNIAGLEYSSDPMHQKKGEINHRKGGRGFYFYDRDGHNLELLTRA